MKKIVVFTKDHLRNVSQKIEQITNKTVSLDKHECKQNTLLKIKYPGEYQGISQGSEAFTTFKKPDQGDYLYILFMLSGQIPEKVLSNNDLALIHIGNKGDFEVEKVNITDYVKNSGCKYKEFTGEGKPWPDFEKLIASINTDERGFQDALDTLFGISKEELLISMKILFLPAYLASKSNESNVSIDEDDLEQLTNIQTTKDGEELQKKFLGSEDGMGDIRQYFSADGKLREMEIPNFRAKYEELCQLS